MVCLMRIISSTLYSFSLFLSFSAAFLLFARGVLGWGFFFLLVSFAVSFFGLLLIHVMEDRFELDLL